MNKRLELLNCSKEDIPSIMSIYEQAREYMQTKNQVVWPHFPFSMLEADLAEGHLWKILINDEIACIWSTTFSDPNIWEEKNIDPSIYIHRIATVPKFRGNDLVQSIVNWAKVYARINQKKYIRMDTVGDNKSLIAHYKKMGFNFLEYKSLKNTECLPDHYKRGPVCFFQITL